MHKTPWKPGWLVRISIVLHGLAPVVLITIPEWWLWIAAALVTNHLVLMVVGLWPRSHWLGENWTTLPTNSAARNEIALTIDDGPDPLVTPQVLDLLDHHGIRATFFCIGEQAARHPELCREIVRRGHAVENHSQTHRHHFSLIGLHGLLREVQAAQTTLTTLTGQTPRFFRAPAGLRNPFLDPVLHRLDLRLASWSIRAFDTREGNSATVKAKLISGLRPGAILLLHDGHAARTPAGIPVITEVIPDLVTAARAAHLDFVTLRQALSHVSHPRTLPP